MKEEKVVLNEDGTVFNFPKNTLHEKWEKLYVPEECKNEFIQDAESPFYFYTICMHCRNPKCPHSVYWQIPDEDKEENDKYEKEFIEYHKIHNPYLFESIYRINKESNKWKNFK